MEPLCVWNYTTISFSIFLSVFIAMYLSGYISAYIHICLYLYRSVRLSVCLYICLLNSPSFYYALKSLNKRQGIRAVSAPVNVAYTANSAVIKPCYPSLVLCIPCTDRAQSRQTPYNQTHLFSNSHDETFKAPTSC